METGDREMERQCRKEFMEIYESSECDDELRKEYSKKHEEMKNEK